MLSLRDSTSGRMLSYVHGKQLFSTPSSLKPYHSSHLQLGQHHATQRRAARLACSCAGSSPAKAASHAARQQAQKQLAADAKGLASRGKRLRRSRVQALLSTS